MPVFWSNVATDPLALNTLGDQRLDLYGATPWLSVVSLAGPEVRQDAAAIFPMVIDDAQFFLTPPPDYAAPTAEGFAAWHSAFQAGHLRDLGPTVLADADGAFTAQYLQLGSDPDPAHNLHVLLSADGVTPIVLNHLDPAAIARLSIEDQRALAALPVFGELIAGPQGLEPGTIYPDAATLRADLAAQIAAEMARILPDYPGYAADRQRFLDEPDSRLELFPFLFVEQIALISQQLDRQAVFDVTAILQSVREVADRFDRLEAFRSMSAPVTGTAIDQNVNTLDNGAAIQAGIAVLLRAEARIYDATAAAAELARTGTYLGREVDGPQLLALVQSFAQSRTEAEAEAAVEAMNQNNKLLEAYTAMQKRMNETLETFANADADAAFGFLGETLLSDLSAEDQLLLAMFDSVAADNGSNSFHPRETELSPDRPMIRMLDNYTSVAPALETHTKQEWDAFVTSLGEMTKLIGQDTQIRMDGINKTNTEKNRHFELASNTLNKATELLRMIIE